MLKDHNNGQIVNNTNIKRVFTNGLSKYNRDDFHKYIMEYRNHNLLKRISEYKNIKDENKRNKELTLILDKYSHYTQESYIGAFYINDKNYSDIKNTLYVYISHDLFCILVNIEKIKDVTLSNYIYEVFRIYHRGNTKSIFNQPTRYQREELIQTNRGYKTDRYTIKEIVQLDTGIEFNKIKDIAIYYYEKLLENPSLMKEYNEAINAEYNRNKTTYHVCKSYLNTYHSLNSMGFKDWQVVQLDNINSESYRSSKKNIHGYLGSNITIWNYNSREVYVNYGLYQTLLEEKIIKPFVALFKQDKEAIEDYIIQCENKLIELNKLYNYEEDIKLREDLKQIKKQIQRSISDE